MKIFTLFIASFILILTTAANAGKEQTEGGIAKQSDRPMRDKTIERSAKDMREVVKSTGRDHLEKSVQKATNGEAKVTSRDREGALKSPAHDRGAIDVVTRNTSTEKQHVEALRMSKEAGAGHTVIVEEKGKGQAGKDLHTVYVNGRKVSTSERPPRATGDHVHLQPEYEIKVQKYSR